MFGLKPDTRRLVKQLKLTLKNLQNESDTPLTVAKKELLTDSDDHGLKFHGHPSWSIMGMHQGSHHGVGPSQHRKNQHHTGDNRMHSAPQTMLADAPLDKNPSNPGNERRWFFSRGNTD